MACGGLARAPIRIGLRFANRIGCVDQGGHRGSALVVDGLDGRQVDLQLRHPIEPKRIGVSSPQPEPSRLSGSAGAIETLRGPKFHPPQGRRAAAACL